MQIEITSKTNEGKKEITKYNTDKLHMDISIKHNGKTEFRILDFKEVDEERITVRLA